MAATLDYQTDVIDRAQRMILDYFADAEQSLTPIGSGLARAGRYDQLEQWLVIRADPARIQGLLDGWGQTVGPEAAQRMLVKESHRLETSLARAGDWDGSDEGLVPAIARGKAAVEARAGTVALSKATKAVDKVDRMQARGAWRFTPVEPPSDFLTQFIGAGIDTPDPNAAAAAAILPPHYPAPPAWTTLKEAAGKASQGDPLSVYPG